MGGGLAKPQAVGTDGRRFVPGPAGIGAEAHPANARHAVTRTSAPSAATLTR